MKGQKKFKTILCCLGLSLALASLWGEAIPVRIQESNGSFTLLRGGEPYFIKGVGGTADLELLVGIGGNSLRTWGGPYSIEALDRIHEAGLSVCVGLWVVHERHGFDYDDDAAVEEQIREHCAVIDEIKDHPAVLMWAIGNEVELQSTNPRVWDVVEAVAAYAKKHDPHHPTMTVIAQSKEAIREVISHCPSIDILGCNSYGGINDLARQLRDVGWEKPYIVTEWGTNGSWEVDKTKWGASLEPSSTEKSIMWTERHELIAADKEKCLGAYAFFWGYKQETTPTWFGIFLEDGSRTELVETLQSIWTGTLPEVRAPQIDGYKINRRSAGKSLRLKKGACAEASFKLVRGDLAEMRVVWELAPESTQTGIGGDPEDRPDELPLEILEQDGLKLEFKVPQGSGAYRLYLYVYGPGNTVATANFPFLVK